MPLNLTPETLTHELSTIANNVNAANNTETLKLLLSCIDLTSLNASDGNNYIKKFVEKVNWFETLFDVSNVAAICVYPSLVPVVKTHLRVPGVKIASVSACFPSSQSFLSVKLAESELAANKGADELDIVISLGMFLEKNYDYVGSEISLIKSIIGTKQLKVILETGELNSIENIYLASKLAIEAGADFIKTSTGKTSVSATPEAVYVMCVAIREYFEKTGKMIGIKPSGGIVTANDALLYYSIVKQVLGDAWLNNRKFRLGASRLANNLLSEIYAKKVLHF